MKFYDSMPVVVGNIRIATIPEHIWVEIEPEKRKEITDGLHEVIMQNIKYSRLQMERIISDEKKKLGCAYCGCIAKLAYQKTDEYGNVYKYCTDRCREESYKGE